MAASDTGLRVLVEPEDAPEIDIVAVHGLNSNPKTTWVKFHSKDSPAAGTGSAGFHPGTMWLDTLLPKYIPNSRILLFNFESNFLFNAPNVELSTLGEQLVYSLRNERQEEPDRPIIFIAYSLGGLVIEQALVFASESEEQVVNIIPKVTKGVVFLGSPLRGTSTAALSTTIVRCARVAGINSHDGLLAVLDETSERLQTLRRSFASLTDKRKTKIVCFYETKPTAIPIPNFGFIFWLFWLLKFIGLGFLCSLWEKRIVVSRESACIDKCPAISLNADHFGMNKFETDTDENFQLVRHEIEALTTYEILTGKQEKLLNELENLRAHAASFDSSANENAPLCLEGTRKDILQMIDQWVMASDDDNILWLYGQAGTGKSTISRTIAGRYSSNNTDQNEVSKGELNSKNKALGGDQAVARLGASFFFNKNKEECKTAAKFVVNLATDLMQHVPGMKRHIVKALEEDHALLKKFLKDQFTKLIEGACINTKLIKSKIVIVIDALDECEGLNEHSGFTDRRRANEQREACMKLIIGCLRQLETSKIKFRILITSRPEIPIRLGFSTIPSELHCDVSLYDMQAATIEHDILSFFTIRLDEIRIDARALGYKISDKWPEKVQIQQLVKISVPLFISAATVCLFLADRQRSPDRQLEFILKNRAAGQSSIYDIYFSILRQLIDTADGIQKDEIIRDFQNIVGTIILLEYPLSQKSLSKLFTVALNDRSPAYDEAEVSATLQKLHSVLNIPKNEADPIQILHLSFREFLTAPGTKTQAKEFWISEQDIHERIARRCINLLSTTLKEDICGLGALGTLREDVDENLINENIPVEVRYACQYWLHHLNQAGERIDISYVQEFLEQHLLKWLEAASLARCLRQIIKQISAFKLNLGPIDLEIKALILDTERFMRYHSRTVEIAPLQIYSSGLLFSPDDSKVKQIYSNRVPKWIVKAPVVEGTWDACLQVLEGHSFEIINIAFSPDGASIASVSYDNSIRLWDVTTGECIRVLDYEPGISNNILFSPDGTVLASTIDDGKVRLWDVYAVTEQVARTLEGHWAFVSHIEFSSDGRLLVSASQDRTIRLWDVASAECIRVLEGHTSWVETFTLSPDGNTLVSLSGDNTLRFWELYATGTECTRIIEADWTFVTAAVFSPNGILVAIPSPEGTLRIFDTVTEQTRMLESNDKDLEIVIFSPDGTLVSGIYADMTIWIWDIVTGKSQTLKGHFDIIKSIAFSPDSRSIASSSHDGTVRLWDVATAKCTCILGGHSDWVKSVAFSPNGTILASASTDKTVRLWDAATEQGSQAYESRSEIIGRIMYSPDGTSLASTTGRSSTSAGGRVRILDSTTGECTRILDGHSEFATSFSFSPDGEILASGSDDETVRIWNIATGESIQLLKGHSNTIQGIDYSPDGKTLASASYDNTVRLWDVATGECVKVMEGHSDWAKDVAFSSDGSSLASASDDKTVRIWDAKTGGCVQTLEDEHMVRNVAFIPNDALLLSSCDSGAVQLWDTVTGECLMRRRYTEPIVEMMVYAHRLNSKVSLNSEGVSNAKSFKIIGKGFVFAFFSESWFYIGGEKVLYLPIDYRCFSAGTKNGNIAVVCPMGRGLFSFTTDADSLLTLLGY
ncbi:hypothetical protein TWF694_003652 [Orbilia ellipsospora]|uniref:Uncharacterized protein n=1 Tax=Orbilia ellipsospora TaxID=2528407 RepID=A0AAV9X4T3_9PEZI